MHHHFYHSLLHQQLMEFRSNPYQFFNEFSGEPGESLNELESGINREKAGT